MVMQQAEASLQGLDWLTDGAICIGLVSKSHAPLVLSIHAGLIARDTFIKCCMVGSLSCISRPAALGFCYSLRKQTCYQ